MSLDKILKRRALRLKTELSEEARPKPGFLSTIYPAQDYGENMPPVIKTPSSIPASNDAEAEEAGDGQEKGEKEVDEPGPSKGASFSQPAIPGEASMVPDAHKRAAFELGYFGENRSEQFIKRCVELITGVKKLESVDADPTEVDDVDIPGDEEEDQGHDGLSDIAKKFSPKPDDE